MIRLLKLSSRERRLLWRALSKLLRVRAKMLVASPDLHTFYGADDKTSSYSTREISIAVGRAAMVLPGTNCLPVAITAASLLRDEGYPCEVRIGVNQADGKLSAHAWVVVDGEPVVGGRVCEDEFQRLPAMPQAKQGKLA